MITVQMTEISLEGERFGDPFLESRTLGSYRVKKGEEVLSSWARAMVRKGFAPGLTANDLMASHKLTRKVGGAVFIAKTDSPEEGYLLRVKP